MRRLEALDREKKLLFPMLAVNDALCKFLFDNRYGTGESVWSGIMRTTNLVVAGKTVVVLGYGWCGKGVAMRARGLGARVIVCEVDPVKAIEACMDGYQVLSSEQAAALGDIFITVTGCRDVLCRSHFEKMKNGAVLANAGHFDVEINLHDLGDLAQERRTARHNIEQFTLTGGRKIYLLGGDAWSTWLPGRPPHRNYGYVSPSRPFRPGISRRTREPGQAAVPGSEEIDRRVALLKLNSLGITIDSLTGEQEAYLNKWQE